MKALKSTISTLAISLLAFFAWSTQAAAIENSVTAVNGYDVVSYHTERSHCAAMDTSWPNTMARLTCLQVRKTRKSLKQTRRSTCRPMVDTAPLASL